MRNIKRHILVPCLAGAAMGLLAASAATAQTCYRLTDLASLGFPPGSDDILRINELGEVAFTAKVTVEIQGQPQLKKHAFVWLPVPNYGLVPGPHDLHMLANLPAVDESAAHDINDAGQVVGQIGEVGPFTNGHAALWRLANGGATVCDLGPIFSGTWAIAYAINDDDPPVVVGDAERGEPRARPPPMDSGLPLMSRNVTSCRSTGWCRWVLTTPALRVT